MNEFLTPTPTINSDHPAIVALANELARDAIDDVSVAQRCFVWVRDNVLHSSDCDSPIVTCRASDVLQHRVGFCYAKSHLLAALLRARAIPTALCYQRLAVDDTGKTFCLHGLVSVYLHRYGWYRLDPRGNHAAVSTDFTPPVEHLAFELCMPGEEDLPGLFADALDCVVSALNQCSTADEVRANLPDAPSRN